MKKIFVFAFAALFSASGFSQEVNDPNAEPRNVKNFHAIDVSNAFDVYLTQGNDEAVAVSASDSKYVSDIITEVKEGVLHISIDWKHKKWNGKMKLKAYIAVKDIDAIELSGATDLYLVGSLNVENLTVKLSGASDWKKGTLNAKKLYATISGASDMKVEGAVQNLKVDASGASDFKGFDLAAEYCDVEASGASTVSITANKELSANASGASDVHYRGEAVIKEMKTSGAGSVKRKS